MSTFTAPLKVRGEPADGDAGPNVTAGDVVVTQTNTLLFSDTTKDLFILPANCQVLDIAVDVTVAFDAGTTNTLNLGTAATPDLFASTLALGTNARVLASSDASQLTNYADTGSMRTTVQGVYAQTGGAATAGAAQITITYAVKTTLPA